MRKIYNLGARFCLRRVRHLFFPGSFSGSAYGKCGTCFSPGAFQVLLTESAALVFPRELFRFCLRKVRHLFFPGSFSGSAYGKCGTCFSPGAFQVLLTESAALVFPRELFRFCLRKVRHLFFPGSFSGSAYGKCGTCFSPGAFQVLLTESAALVFPRELFRFCLRKVRHLFFPGSLTIGSTWVKFWWKGHKRVGRKTLRNWLNQVQDLDCTKRHTIIDITSDSQVNSNFPYRWSPASLTFNNYFYLFLYLYITWITINNNAPHLKSPKNHNRRAALGRPAIKITGGLQLVCGRPTLAHKTRILKRK